MNQPQRRSLQATVIGDSDPRPEAIEAAERVGAMLARIGVTVVTGGLGGIMEAASRGARNNGGTAVGILPSAALEDANPWCNIVIPTGLGHARNVLTALAGDFVIAVGGGTGTLSEICFGWIHGKPILLLQSYGGWSDKLDGSPLDHRKSSTIRPCASLTELETAVTEVCQELSRR